MFFIIIIFNLQKSDGRDRRLFIYGIWSLGLSNNLVFSFAPQTIPQIRARPLSSQVINLFHGKLLQKLQLNGDKEQSVS